MRELAELLGRHRQLAAPARVRADRTDVEMADRDAERARAASAKLLGPFDLIGIEIDVGVEVADRGSVMRAPLAEARADAQLGFPWRVGGYKRAFSRMTGRLLGRRQVVRHRFLVPAFAGSNPAAPASPSIAESLLARLRRL